ncbi:P-loop NTPase fold protein [Erysipelothrix rhusiopathiae]|nr:P-loop NTPase fold protein [Erysipelothrix rhusiopathiae]MDE8224720.1 P-loop NTPase fold protein [Erysipelothrix rhusiopathiae]MDE8259140.1 P-loop NTPase fold protein [Erysipelothrix rhusiopathiae]
MVRIEKIDTSNNAKIFANMINDSPKTYFLDGKWGSGKTEYLKEVEKYIRKDIRKDIRVINVELWKPKDKSTLSQLMFESIYPFKSKLINRTIKLFIFLSVMGSMFIAFKGFSPKEFSVSESESMLFGIILSISTIITTLYTFIGAKWVDLDRYYMGKSIQSLIDIERPKLLIIDDFDRLEESVRNELFLLFNSIHGRTRVVFIGDLHNLDNVKLDYISKIIDKKVSLPYPLHSSNIAVELLKKIKEIIGNNYIQLDNIKDIFEKEKRTARDANHLLTYIHQELISNDKLGKVQISQQILIIYLYVFHVELYQKLVDQLLPHIDEKKQELHNGNVIDNHGIDLSVNCDIESEVVGYTNYLLQPNGDNPTDYISNRNAYYVNEIVNTHSIFELQSILIDNNLELKKIFLDSTNSLLYSEFLNYITRMSLDEYQKVKLTLEENAISALKSEVRHIPNDLIKHIFQRKVEETNNHFSHRDRRDSLNSKKVFILFDIMFDSYEKKHTLTISILERIYYYRSTLNLDGPSWFKDNIEYRKIPYLNKDRIKETYSENAYERLESQDFGKKDYDAEALVVLMNTQLNKDSISEFEKNKELIEKLKDSEYLALWDAFGIRPETDSKIGQYLIYGDVLDFPYGNKKYKEVVLERIISITN